MIEIQINDVIQQSDPWMEMFGGGSISAESIKRRLEENPNDPDLMLIINSPGGSVDEGFSIYDLLRTSGKNIYAHIEGECHSMAIVLLLSAPLKNRTANPNARALIHEVRTDMYDATEHSAQATADMLKEYKGRMLDIYADRTGGPREDLKIIMEEEKIRFPEFLIEQGFISKLKAYNTNINLKNKNSMAKQEKARGILNSIAKLLNLGELAITPEIVNYDYTDKDGNTVFSTPESEDQVLKVGDKVTLANGETSGTFIIEQNGVDVEVEIEAGEVKEIKELDATLTSEELTNQLTEVANVLKEEVLAHEAEQTAHNETRTELENTKSELQNLKMEIGVKNASIAKNSVEITNLKKLVGSNHKPEKRMGNNIAHKNTSGGFDRDAVRAVSEQVKK